MRQKVAKALRRLARKICTDKNVPYATSLQYKKLKKAHKAAKGHI